MALSEFERVYAQIKQAAHRQMTKHAAQTLSTTELVHEAYLKLGDFTAGRDRLDTVRLFAHAVRQVLIDAARRRQTEKRGASPLRVTFSPELLGASDADGLDVFALNQAITQLKEQDERIGLVVELHFFAGLPFVEIAELFGVDRRTIFRDWTAARLILARSLGVEPSAVPEPTDQVPSK